MFSLSHEHMERLSGAIMFESPLMNERYSEGEADAIFKVFKITAR